MQTVADRATPGEKLYRSFNFTECEFRDDGPDGFLTFEGIASVVEARYTVRDAFGEFKETIHAGSFDKSCAELHKRASKAKRAPVDTDEARASDVDEPDAALYTNHDYRALPLAVVSAGRLKFEPTPHLFTRAFLNPKRPSVQEARYAVEDGEARQMSIGFSVPKGKGKDVWSDDYTSRSIYEVKLHEASIVWRGANHHTSGAIRAAEQLMEMIETGDYDEAELRRLIAALESRLPDPGPGEVPAYVAEQNELLARAWEMRRHMTA